MMKFALAVITKNELMLATIVVVQRDYCGCSTAVERATRHQEVVGSNTAG